MAKDTTPPGEPEVRPGTAFAVATHAHKRAEAGRKSCNSPSDNTRNAKKEGTARTVERKTTEGGSCDEARGGWPVQV